MPKSRSKTQSSSEDTAGRRPRRWCGNLPAAGRSPNSATWSACLAPCSAATPSPGQTEPSWPCFDELKIKQRHIKSHCGEEHGRRRPLQIPNARSSSAPYSPVPPSLQKKLVFNNPVDTSYHASCKVPALHVQRLHEKEQQKDLIPSMPIAATYLLQ